MDHDQAYWLHKLATLKIARNGGDPAPHKPLLLLAIIDMADHGQLGRGDELPLTPDLAFRFSVYWSVVVGRRKARPDVRLPFHHLKTSGIWQALMADGSPSPDSSLTKKIRFTPSFRGWLNDAAFRDTAKRLLLDTPPYFQPDEREALYALLGIKPAASGTGNGARPPYPASVERGRDARFRIEVVIVAYRHTCALTGYRMTTIHMESIVDAAHIHEFRDSRNNDPRNGLALSKNAHWQFDRGLWSITDDYRIIVNHGKFSEEGKQGLQLSRFHGEKLFLPANRDYWPDPTHLRWHRDKHAA